MLFYLLNAEEIESNPGPQTGSTRGNSFPRGDPSGRGHGCNGHRSGHGSKQDYSPIDNAFVDTSVRDPTGLSNGIDQALYLTPVIQIIKSTVSLFSTVSDLLAYRLPNSDSTGRIE